MEAFFQALCFAIRPSILFRVVLGMPVRPDSWKILLLIAPGTFRKFLFKLFRSRFVTDLRMPRSERVFPFFMGPCTNRFSVTKWPLIFFATFSNGVDMANSFMISGSFHVKSSDFLAKCNPTL